MESPPSSSSWSHTFILSDDSGLLLTNGSNSSCTTSFESKNDIKHFLYEDTDSEERSLSHDGSVDGMSDIICGQNYNTLKKGPYWIDSKPANSPIEPPEEFQDKPRRNEIEAFCCTISETIIRKALIKIKEVLKSRYNMARNTSSQLYLQTGGHQGLASKPNLQARATYFTPDFIPFSPCHAHYLGVRPSSRSSLGGCSRRSSSHSSLYVPTASKADDSSFITQAVSHDALSSDKISDLYNVPFDSDMYAVPLDVIKPSARPRQITTASVLKKKRRNTSLSCRELEEHLVSNERWGAAYKCNMPKPGQHHSCYESGTKRHSLAGSSTRNSEPIHMTLKEVRQYLQTMYSSSSDTSESGEIVISRPKLNLGIISNNNNRYSLSNLDCKLNDAMPDRSKKMFLLNIKNQKLEETCDNSRTIISPKKKEDKKRRLINFRQALLGVFKFKKSLPIYAKTEINNKIENVGHTKEEAPNLLGNRALPPLPAKEENPDEEQTLDFATSIQKVKDYGWYWGPISSEAAEKILSNEPDGSFIVRDSSDDHYIFSLTFKLNSSVRHVRIEHDQGNFSFGSCTKFKSQTIVDFIENAVEHSRSGRYLFFLHRRPVIGPVRVQLLHPVSRFKQVQSLQHICRFVIHKNVRRDLIPNLPLPRRMIDYLNTPHYYSEHFIDLQT